MPFGNSEPSLSCCALAVLETPDAHEKSRLTRSYSADWKAGGIPSIGHATPPDRPARAPAPVLLPPSEMPRRSKAGLKGRIALVHALAHIELNAIDLAWDIIARFTGQDLPRAFYDDWVQVAFDEAEHFDALDRLLGDMGAAYGDLPAHDGLWQAAFKTRHDLMDRLVLVPMTLEARGLDTTPASIRNLERHGHTGLIPALSKILEDEIAHVAAGTRWFNYLCQLQGLSAVATYKDRLGLHFPKGPKPPFNREARLRAGQTPDYYDWSI
ncbi:MAG: ferritin-like domain-containing protein [Rhodospirillales bacterium]|nr:MAG: ferritin-like domain-containing protein [Rhodospirillales bacterium]